MKYLKINLLAFFNTIMLLFITGLKLLSGLVKALGNIIIYVVGFVIIYMLCDWLIGTDISSFFSDIGAFFELILVCVILGAFGMLVLAISSIAFAVIGAVITAINAIWMVIASIICDVIDWIADLMIRKVYYPVYNLILNDENYECIFTSVYSLENNGEEFVKINASLNKEADQSLCFKCFFVNVLACLEVALNAILNKKNWFEIVMTITSLVAFVIYQNSLTNEWLNINYLEFLSCYHWTDIFFTSIIIVYLLVCVFHMSFVINENMDNYLGFVNKIIERKEISLE